MRFMSRQNLVTGMLATLLLAAASNALAQAQAPSNTPEHPWTAEASIGWDNSISGNINSSAIGRLNNQAVVITKNRYEDVYGTGLQFRFGGGYMLDEHTEVRAAFTFQSLDADLTPMGDFGASRLYGQYADYQSFALDVGLRRYQNRRRRRSSSTAKARSGSGSSTRPTSTLVAPAANLFRDATDFYDQTAAFTLGGNAGVLFQTSAADRDLRPGGPALDHRHVRGGRPGGHGSRDHQRQERALDVPVPRRPQGPVLEMAFMRSLACCSCCRRRPRRRTPTNWPSRRRIRWPA